MMHESRRHWATYELTHGRASHVLSLNGSGGRIEIGDERADDGLVRGERIYFTGVDGKIVIVNRRTLKSTRSLIFPRFKIVIAKSYQLGAVASIPKMSRGFGWVSHASARLSSRKTCVGKNHPAQRDACEANAYRALRHYQQTMSAGDRACTLWYECGLRNFSCTHLVQNARISPRASHYRSVGRKISRARGSVASGMIPK
jgi:hypothetical protein